MKLLSFLDEKVAGGVEVSAAGQRFHALEDCDWRITRLFQFKGTKGVVKFLVIAWMALFAFGRITVSTYIVVLAYVCLQRYASLRCRSALAFLRLQRRQCSLGHLQCA